MFGRQRVRKRSRSRCWSPSCRCRRLCSPSAGASRSRQSGPRVPERCPSPAGAARPGAQSSLAAPNLPAQRSGSSSRARGEAGGALCGLATPLILSMDPGSPPSSRGSGGAALPEGDMTEIGSPHPPSAAAAVFVPSPPHQSSTAVPADREPCSGCGGARAVPLPCPSLPACSRGACQASLQHPLTPTWRGGRAQGSCRGAEGRACSWGGLAAWDPSWAMNLGTRGCPAQCLPAWWGVWSLCCPQSWAISSWAPANCPLGWWGRSFPQMCAPISQLCLPGTGQGSPWFWVGAHVAPWLHPGAQAWGSRGSWSALARDTRGAGGPGWGQGAFHPPADGRVPHLPLASLPPADAFAWGLEQAGRGWEYWLERV